jgi:hypothetical protein
MLLIWNDVSKIQEHLQKPYADNVWDFFILPYLLHICRTFRYFVNNLSLWIHYFLSNIRGRIRSYVPCTDVYLNPKWTKCMNTSRTRWNVEVHGPQHVTYFSFPWKPFLAHVIDVPARENWTGRLREVNVWTKSTVRAACSNSQLLLHTCRTQLHDSAPSWTFSGFQPSIAQQKQWNQLTYIIRCGENIVSA